MPNSNCTHAEQSRGKTLNLNCSQFDALHGSSHPMMYEWVTVKRFGVLLKLLEGLNECSPFTIYMCAQFSCSKELQVHRLRLDSLTKVQTTGACTKILYIL